MQLRLTPENMDYLMDMVREKKSTVDICLNQILKEHKKFLEE